jgi:hypothetical protein
MVSADISAPGQGWLALRSIGALPLAPPSLAENVSEGVSLKGEKW